MAHGVELVGEAQRTPSVAQASFASSASASPACPASCRCRAGARPVWHSYCSGAIAGKSRRGRAELGSIFRRREVLAQCGEGVYD